MIIYFQVSFKSLKIRFGHIIKKYRGIVQCIFICMCIYEDTYQYKFTDKLFNLYNKYQPVFYIVWIYSKIFSNTMSLIFFSGQMNISNIFYYAFQHLLFFFFHTLLFKLTSFVCVKIYNRVYINFLIIQSYKQYLHMCIFDDNAI